MRDFEEEYLDVLQNIEFAIVNVYRQQRDLVDYDVEQALNSLVREYQSREQGRSLEQPEFAPPVHDVYDGVLRMCEWRLGLEDLLGEGDLPFGNPEPLSLDEIVACLKRIRKSVRKWKKRGGRQGYLHFIDQFIK
jgi:hypothetical protein